MSLQPKRPVKFGKGDILGFEIDARVRGVLYLYRWRADKAAKSAQSLRRQSAA